MEPSTPSPRQTHIPGTRTLLRGLDILFAIGESPRAMRFRDIQALVGLPKGTLHRVLAALQDRGVIRLDPRTRLYHLGPRLIELVGATADQSTIIRAAKPEIVRLARRLGRPICIYVANAQYLFVIDFEDPDPAQGQVARVWPRVSFVDSAPGLAALAAMTPEARLATLGGQPDPEGLGMCKALGYAVTDEGRFSAVASAVRDHNGYPVAAICCLVEQIAARMDLLHEIGRLVSEAGQRASGNYTATNIATPVLPAPPSTPAPSVLSLETGRDFVGENPLWLAESDEIVWIDVLAPALRIYNGKTKRAERVPLPQITGGIAQDIEERFILLGQNGFMRFDRRSGDQTLIMHPEAGQPDNRFNSAAVAPDGSIWVGTMSIDHTPHKGKLYRIGSDLRVTVADCKIGLPKNPAWSPDGSTLYISDGATGRLLAYDCDLPTATLGNPRPLVSGTSDTGIPNGVAVDREGNIWVTMLGGWAVHCYSPEGRLLEAISLPVPMPTNLCFGGADLKTLYITSTHLRLPPGFSVIAPSSGNLFCVRVDAEGMVQRRFGDATGQ